MKSSLIILSSILISLCSDKRSDRIERDIDQMSINDNMLKSRKWTVVSYDNDFDNGIEIEIEAGSEDSVFHISYFSPDDIERASIISSYNITIIDSAFMYRTLLENFDTCYSYRVKISDINKMSKRDFFEFYVGEYCYRQTHLLHNSTQRNYYSLNEDSLKRIRGNHLPSLGVE